MLRIITHIVVTLVIVQVIFTEKVSPVCFPFLQICCLQYILASIVWKTWYRTSCKCDALLKHWNKDESSVRIPKKKRLSVEIDFLRQTISIWWWKIFFLSLFQLGKAIWRWVSILQNTSYKNVFPAVWLV